MQGSVIAYLPGMTNAVRGLSASSHECRLHLRQGQLTRDIQSYEMKTPCLPKSCIAAKAIGIHENGRNEIALALTLHAALMLFCSTAVSHTFNIDLRQLNGLC